MINAFVAQRKSNRLLSGGSGYRNSPEALDNERMRMDLTPHARMRMKMIGFIAVTSINHLMDAEEHEVFGGGCCVSHCGQCAALKWFQSNDIDFLDGCVQMIGEGAWYDWQNDDGTVDWNMLEEQWNKHKGCVTDEHGVIPCE